MDTATVLWLLLIPAVIALYRELMIHFKIQPRWKNVKDYPSWARLAIVLLMGIIPGLLYLWFMDKYQERLNRWFYRLP